ncbi:uncharacterized protein LOC121389141 [Gigantopelta aegis]|uniref:uncharacterized protein LOC121389141 n=1 Tax=Gigantopelta aegis TaxID=1735272 RepID=UPI001B88A02C|nr:uncharacterized protein LOC121389141 [Gigantopelta aegis]
MDMVSLAKYNDGVRYLMMIIDLFSRYLWVLPLKSKTGNDVVDALTEFWKLESRKRKLFQSDSGSEYKNHKVKALLKSHGITQLFALNETKASYAERVIKTIKMRLYRYMLKNYTYKYMDVLEKVVYSYNHTKHRMLGQTPASVNQTNEGEVRLSQYLIKPKKAIHKNKFTFNIGDKVRVSHLQGTFDREYQEKWSGEIFTIEKRYWSQGKDLYKLKDWGGDAIKGTFYAAELQKVTENPDQLYRIQDIVKRRTRNKQKEVLVKWLHWSKKYNSWIQEADVVRYQTDTRPTSQITTENSPVEFNVYGQGVDYIDLKCTKLHVRAKITKADGSILTKDEKVGPVNLWLQSFWSQVDLTLNGKLVTTSTNLYPYKSYLKVLLNGTSTAKESSLQSQLYYKDTSDDIDSVDPITGIRDLLTEVLYVNGVTPWIWKDLCTKTF